MMEHTQESERQAFTRAYLECAAWCGVSEENRDGGEFHADEFHSSALIRAREDCETFIAEAGALLGQWSAVQAGHDFWLTRNHHGAGFWDRGNGAEGDEATKLAHAAGSVDVYVGDDGYLYFA